jgi:Tol biopolymer transport system component
LLADSRAQGRLRGAAWSGSGRLIAYKRNCTTDRDGTYCGLGVMNADGTSKRLIERNVAGSHLDGTTPVWIPGTNQLVFTNWGTDHVRVLDAVTGRSTAISTKGFGWQSVRVAQDGKTVGGITGGQGGRIVLTRPDGTVVAQANMPVDYYWYDTDLWIG